MTTIVKVITNNEHPVRVTMISPTDAVSHGEAQVNPGEVREFYVHGAQDLRIHEIQPVEAPAEAVTHTGLPVAGYRPQSAVNVARVNAVKQTEERLLRLLDELKADPEIDQRWLQIGRTSIEQGFMDVVRSIFKPERVELAE